MIKKRLFLSVEEKVGGPRRMILPPRELDPAIDALALGSEVNQALRSFRDAGRHATAEEWEIANAELLRLMGETTVASFEKKKREVTLRRDRQSQEVRLSGPKDELVVLQQPDATRLGDEIRRMLRL